MTQNPSARAAPWSEAPQVGLLDIDICGPSVPKMLGLEGQEIHQSNMGWSPVYVDVPEGALGVMSIGAHPPCGLPLLRRPYIQTAPVEAVEDFLPGFVSTGVTSQSYLR